MVSSTTSVSSFEEFSRILRDNWEGHHVFRGEDSDAYPLLSKWGRCIRQSAANDARSERGLVRAFVRHATPHCDRAPKDDWEWLALAQHHGVATRLLDWTENPLVAAYFATRDIVRRADRVVYILDLGALPAADDISDPLECNETVAYRPRHFARRVAAQGAVLTCHPKPESEFTSTGLRRVVIEDQAVNEIYSTLESFGVHEAFAFPDLDGIARHLNQMYIRPL